MFYFKLLIPVTLGSWWGRKIISSSIISWYPVRPLLITVLTRSPIRTSLIFLSVPSAINTSSSPWKQIHWLVSHTPLQHWLSVVQLLVSVVQHTLLWQSVDPPELSQHWVATVQLACSARQPENVIRNIHEIVSRWNQRKTNRFQVLCLCDIL